jgi:hypothetical protein
MSQYEEDWDGEETGPEQMIQDCFGGDPRRPRLLTAQCATCILRPGNPMHLTPGRLRGMLQAALREGSQGIICHDTLTYGPHPDFGPALCRGFYDQFGYRNNFIRIMGRLGGFAEVDPPAPAEPAKPGNQITGTGE